MAKSPQPLVGSRPLKADFHTHTPASGDYSEKIIVPSDFVQAALRAGLDAIAVTDHNSAEWVDLARSAAKGKGLIVFPGVEITTPTGHILAIYDPDTPKSTLDDLLSQVGIATKDRGKETAMSSDVETVLAAISKSGGIAIAAHANSSSGFLKEGKGQFKIKVCNGPCLHALEFTSRADVEKFINGQVPGYPAKPCIQGSDAHSLLEIGRRYCYLTMDCPSIEGLRQALLDHPVRIHYSWNAPRVAHPHIIEMAVNQGFFQGVTLPFNPQLNCFVGGQGTGKSTAIELLRFAFCDTSPVEVIADAGRAKIKNLLGDGGVVTVKYMDSDGAAKLISRECHSWDEQHQVVDQDGDPAVLNSVPAFYSQGEIIRIAEDLGAQMNLIDRYVDVAGELAGETSLCQELALNASKLVTEINKRDQYELQISDPDKGLVAVTKRKAAIEKILTESALKEFPRVENEKRAIAAAKEGIARFRAELNSLLDGLDVSAFEAELPNDSPNREQLKSINDLGDTYSAILAELKKVAAKKLLAKARQIDLAEASWKPLYAGIEKRYKEALQKIGAADAAKAASALRNLATQFEQLKNKQKELTAATNRIAAYEQEREQLRTKLVSARAARHSKRQAKAELWQQQLGGKIKVQVEKCGETGAYLELLSALSRGALLRDQDKRTIAEKCGPSVFVKLVLTNDALGLAKAVGLKQDTAQKCIDTVLQRGLKAIYELESVIIPDKPVITYEVEPGKDRPLRELSVGQKGTVILSLAMIEGEGPLIIDQPEEPMDTLAIYDQIVKKIRQLKTGRQYIFTTHNANVAVGADSDLSIVLEATADRGQVKTSGGVDRPEVNKLLLYHLEGGPEAFRLRSQKYATQ
jgi:energy-coupling factor transporter ATP-binding protein EcfA2